MSGNVSHTHRSKSHAYVGYNPTYYCLVIIPEQAKHGGLQLSEFVLRPNKPFATGAYIHILHNASPVMPTIPYKVVWIASMPRSASMWAFHITLSLLRTSR